MARPKKNRMVYSMPPCEGFIPLGCSYDSKSLIVTMTVDEYETIRIIDLLGETQDVCAENMNVSRPTVTNIYESARKKLADALINEKTLLIEGGDFDICLENKKIGKLEKEKRKMKIAVTYDNGQIFQHFGHCENFKIYNVENEAVTSSKVENAGGTGHGALASLLNDFGVDVLICGGIGGGAQTALAEAGIKLFGGVTGDADAAVDSLLQGDLEYNANVQCNHHDENHSCGNHNENHLCAEHSKGHSCNNRKC